MPLQPRPEEATEQSPEGPEEKFVGTERFEIVSHLGSGGMGSVYEAFDRERNARVAIKVLKRLTPQGLLFFKREFRALADIQHPNLVSLGELFESEEHFFFTMELIRGRHFAAHVRGAKTTTSGSNFTSSPTRGRSLEVDTMILDRAPELEEVVATLPPPARGTLDEERLRASLEQLVTGLEALHRAGKVHRDIKPSNILVTDEGRLVILDFGLVEELTDEEGVVDALMGTVAYMAPEQAKRERVGAAADWYAVGAVVYHALTGRPPFVGPISEILRAKQAILPTRPSRIVEDIPSDLEALCMDLLAIEPAERPGPRDILARLEAAQTPDLSPSNLIEFAPQRNVFVGRDRELEQLRAAFERSRAGISSAVLVVGESGVGKSALVRRFCDGVGEFVSSRLLLRGRCYERESVPYKAIDEVVDALSRYLTELPEPARDELVPSNAALLGKIFPVLRRLPGFEDVSAGEELPPLERRSRAFAALRELLFNVARRRPTVVVIDDLQWTDVDSLSLLTEILRPPNPPPFLLIATIRTVNEAAPGVRTPEQLAQYIPLPTRTIQVGALPPEDASALVHELVGTQVQGVDLQAVIDEANGHPLFIDALLRYRASARSDARGVLLDDALRWRVSELEAGPRELLELLCVAGTPLAQRVAAWATVNDANLFGRWVGSLRQANLARTTGPNPSDVIESFHDRVREAVFEGLDETARRRWHVRLAVALEEVAENADSESLAFHWFQTRQTSRAVEHMWKAADGAVETLAFERAARLYTWCLDNVGDDLDPRKMMKLRTSLGEALVTAGRCAEGARQFLAVAPDAEPRVALDLKRKAAEQLLKSGYLDQGYEVLEDVIDTVGMSLPKTPTRALILLLGRRVFLRLRGTSYKIRPEAEIDPALLAKIDVAWSASASLALVNTIQGVLFQEWHFSLALKAGEIYRLSRAFAVQAWYASNIGAHNRERTYELVNIATELAKQSGRQHALALIEATGGAVNYLMGAWRIAAENTQIGIAKLRACREGTTHEIDTVMLFGYSAMAQLGDFHRLGNEIPFEIRAADEREDRFAAVNLRSGHINALWLAKDEPHVARERCDEAAQHLSKKAFYVQHYYDLLARLHIDFYQGDVQTAYERLHSVWKAFWGSLLPRVQHPRMFGFWMRARAAVNVARVRAEAERPGLWAEAEKFAQRLMAESAEWGKPAGTSVLAAVAAGRGHEDEAIGHLELAARGFEAEDMLVHAAAARRERALLQSDERARAEAEAVMKDNTVVDPEKFSRVFVPVCRR